MPFLTREVRRMKDINNWTAEDILFTLNYIFTYSPNPPEFLPQYGITGLVERSYSFAKRQQRLVEEANKVPEEIINKAIKKPVRIIQIKRSAIIKNNNLFQEREKNRIYGPEIDLNNIIDDDCCESEKGDY